MVQRCYDPKCTSFPNYGGRGITVCQRWHNSFENFLADMGERPEGRNGKRAAYSIDRIDVDGDYEPGNCRWATCKEQSRNTRSVKLSEQDAAAIRADGQSRLADLASKYGVTAQTIRNIRHGKTWAPRKEQQDNRGSVR